MKEKDIDKIFSEALQNEVEPTYPGDWENFEKSLSASGSRGTLMYWFLGLFGLIALTGMTIWTVHYFESQETRQYTERDAISRSNSKSGVSENTKFNQAADTVKETGVKDHDTPGQEGVQTMPDSTKLNHIGSTIDGEQTLEGTDLPVSNSGKATPESDPLNTSGKVAASTTNTIGNSAQNLSNSDTGKIGKNSKAKNVGSITEMAGFDSDEIEKSKAPKQSEQSETRNSDEAINGRAAANRSVEKIDLHSMNSLTGIIPQPEVEERGPGNPERLEIYKPGRFEPVLFIGIEQNTVLKTSPHFGVMGQWHFSKWTAGVGVALQRSGTLNWIQTSTSTSYGFQKYENSTEIRTESIDLLSFPVKVNRRLGGLGHVFVGYSPSIVVNARQQKTVFIDGTPAPSLAKSGYLYKTGAPAFISFFSAGYGYDLDERWNLEIGINTSFQKWKISDKTPLGGFLQLNYRFK